MQKVNRSFGSFYTHDIKFKYDDIAKINLQNLSFNHPFTCSHRNFFKKRNYIEFLRQYQNKLTNFYPTEKEIANKIFSKNNIEYMDKKLLNTSTGSLIKIRQSKISPPSNNLNTKNESKKFLMEEDTEINEKSCNISKIEQKKQKQKLSASYFLDEDPGFFSDLEDTKESSLYSLNLSFDFPEISLDDSIKDKLITNALELEKTFNRFYNMKTFPNKT